MNHMKKTLLFLFLTFFLCLTAFQRGVYSASDDEGWDEDTSSSTAAVEAAPAAAESESPAVPAPAIEAAKTPVHSGAAQNYKIGVGDLLEIEVYDEDDLTKEVRVLTDGYISFPLLGSLQAAGMSVSDLEALITKKLGEK